MKTGQAKDQNRVESLVTETKKMQTMMNDLRGQINDLENRNVILERQYNDLLRQHEEVSLVLLQTTECFTYVFYKLCKDSFYSLISNIELVFNTSI